MLVDGGRRWWLRVLVLVAAAGALGVSGSACGGRTSTLDPDAYALGNGGSLNPQPSGNAGKSTTGTGLLGRAGTSSTTPTAGAPSGVDTSLAISPCKQYCPGYGTQCKKRLEGQDCLATCQGELNGYGVTCQTLGIQALQCLTPFFNPKGGDCNAAVNRALAQCGPIVTAFDDCKKDVARPSQPTRPAVDFNGCKRSGNPQPASCKETFYCASGNFTTFCSAPGGSMLADCSCVGPDGATSEASLPPSDDICLKATALCQ